MAHRICAVDFGAWSLKVAIADHGFRQAAIADVIERELAAPQFEGEAYDQRAARTLAAIVAEKGLEHDTAYFVVAGDQLFTKVLDFQFQKLGRGDLEKAIGAELEGVVPIDLEDMVYAFEPLPRPAAPAAPAPAAPGAPATGEPAFVAGDDDPTKVQGGGQGTATAAATRGRVAPAHDGMRVLTYAMRRDRAQALILLGAGAKAEPRGLLPIAGVLAKFAARAVPQVAGPFAVIDMGHERTDVVIVSDGKPVFSRTIARGGRHVTDAIARAWKLPVEQAEQAKRADGLIASSTEPPQSEAWQRISEVTAGELVPLARDLRQTLAACRARTGIATASVVVVGGAARLRGMASFLAEQLGVPVAPPAPEASALCGPRMADLPIDHGAAAIGAALDGASGRPMFDLRQGALAFKVDLSFLRTKAYQLAAATVVVLAFAAGSAWASYYKLHKNEQILTDRLATESSQLFGSPKSAEDILHGKEGVAAAAESPLPKNSAYDLLLDINSKLPPKDKITLDVTQLDINESSIEIRGTTKKPEEIDALDTALKEVQCLGPATRGSTQQTAEGIQFQLSYKPSCM
jgi:Tfp pilus assembly PilM family ATPase